MTNDLTQILLGTALLAGPAAAGAAALLGRDPVRASSAASRTLAGGAAAALGLVVATFADGPVDVTGFEVTPAVALVLVLVLATGATVVGFASRSLRHEPYQAGFATTASLVVGAAAVLATTTDLLVLAAAWTATSLFAVRLVATGPAGGAPASPMRRSFVVADLFLVGAVAALVVASGSTAIADLETGGVLAVAAGMALVVAAAARSAGVPFHRWLPASTAAPTPASALLHAGVVNAGAIVLIKLAPVTTASLPAAALAVALGGVSCIAAEAIMLTRA
ncbi:MAG TPA: proton-conducting transporter membrane subunit, partial [Aquihabitans sp.]|nr:proton-conducting transporter membrane subunit [Aquihabitans sp.]